MTKAQELQLRSSEIRERLNVLQSAEKRSDADRAEMNKLTTELTDVETRFRAALSTETTTEETCRCRCADPHTCGPRECRGDYPSGT